MKKGLVFYLVALLSFVLLIYGLLQLGHSLEAGKPGMTQAVSPPSAHPDASADATLPDLLHHPLPTLILQILVILLASQCFAALATRLGQPRVIGEIIAGIVLGPSLLGLLLPDAHLALFPPDSLPTLQLLSQLGLMLFMFIVGLELDLSQINRKATNAVVISHASIVFPYFLGVLLAYFLYQDFAPASISFTAFALFMGIAMSITAFPVLVRILQERGMSQHPLGVMAITCAASDDITAWCLLAVVIAIVKAESLHSAAMTIVMTFVFLIGMWYGIRPLLARLAERYLAPGSTIDRRAITIAFTVLLMSALITEIIGIHALFGAFFAGAILPADKALRRQLAEKIEHLSLVLLLPLFFAYTGLRTEIGLLDQWHLWAICLLVIVVAIAGKFLGSALAARCVGHPWNESLIIGALMNTRGLMELVVLNIGYDLGILSAEIFTMMVIMALATTLMTGPMLDLITRNARMTSHEHQ